MAVHITETNDSKILEVLVSGKLTADDYKQFIPEFERLIQQQGKISLLFEMRDFHGWEAGALWQDIKFDFKHFADIERLAMVGDKKWEKWMADFCRPFTTAKIRYFDLPESDAARRWVAGQADEAAGQSPTPIVP
jgi:hypothetical protein